MELTVIPAYKKQFIRAAIYARVSTSGRKQLESLSAQVSALTQYVYSKPGWDLWNIYMEVGSSKTGAHRKEFDKLVDDCQKRKIDYVLVKSVERFGRDTKEVIGAVRKIRQAGANVLFFSEGIDTGPMMFEMELSLAAAIAQADNESRSKNIRLGLIYGAENGTSGLYRRKCYGYDKDENGDLVINEAQAAVVRLIYKLCAEGNSINKIREYLWQQQIPTPTGELNVWSKKSVSDILMNMKYIGHAIIKPCREPGGHIAKRNACPVIVEKEVYKKAQTQLAERTKREPAKRKITEDDVYRTSGSSNENWDYESSPVYQHFYNRPNGKNPAVDQENSADSGKNPAVD